MSRGVRLAVLVSIGLMLSACGGQEASTPSLPPGGLEGHVVEAVATPRERSWDGVVEAVHQATLSAQTGGRVLELPFDVNDTVEAGQVVVRFTDVEQVSGQRQAGAALQAAQAAFNEAEADYQRIRGIFERQLVSRAQMDQALARRDAARAQLEAARASLSAAGEQVDYTVVRAPYTGILTERFVEVGETVGPGQPLVAGLSLDRLRIAVDVPQSDVAAIRRHASAAVLLEDGRRLQAADVLVFPYADPRTHSFRVRVELPESRTGLHPGMTAKVAFMLEEQPRLVVPAAALVQRGELSAVYVLDEAGAPALRQVRPGQRFDDSVEILAGLGAGERIAQDPVAALAWLAEHRRGGRRD